jgi:hypothetical protein
MDRQAGQVTTSLVVERRRERRVRVFGYCLPIPLGLGLLATDGLASDEQDKAEPARPW